MNNPSLLAAEILQTCEEKGFYCPASVDQDDPPIRLWENEAMLGKLYLVLDELGEAHDEMIVPHGRRGEEEEIPPRTEVERQQAIRAEIADVAIRLLHIVGACRIELPGFVHYRPIAAIASELYKPLPLWWIGKSVRNAGSAARNADQGAFDEWIQESLAMTVAVAASHGFDLWPEVEKKMETNRARPAKHGKKSRL